MKPTLLLLAATLMTPAAAIAQSEGGTGGAPVAPGTGQSGAPAAGPAGPPAGPAIGPKGTGQSAGNAMPGASAPGSNATLGVPDGLPALASVNATLDGIPSVIAARARLEAARAHARQLAVGSYEITAEANYDRRFIRAPGNDYSVNELNLIANRAFRLPGKAALDRKAGYFEVIAAENTYADARHQVALTLASAWFDLVAANERAALLQRSVGAERELLRAVSLRVDYKDAAKLDADRAEVELGMVQGQYASAESDLARARAVLSGIYPSLISEVVPSATVLLTPTEATLTTWRDRILADSHELRAAQAEYDRQAALASRARLNRIADPTLGGRVFTEQGGNEKGVGVQLSIPLGGRYRAAVADQSSAEATAALALLAQVRREVQVTADADLADARGQLAAYAISHRTVAAAQTATLRLEEGYRLGGVDLADLLYARRQQRDAELSEADARTKAARAVTKLRIDAHILWAAPDADE